MTNVDEIINSLICGVRNDLIETKHKIKQLEREVKAYETVIERLEAMKGDDGND